MRFKILSTICISVLIFLSGCGDKPEIDPKPDQSITEKINLDATIGAYGEIFASSDIFVEGYGIVAGLNGSGSSEVPPQLREYLIKYIQQMLGNANRFEAMQFLNSTDNAAVRIYGIIPSGAPKGSKFDVAVEALSSTQTTSLAGGSLYTSDLTSSSRLGVAGAKKLGLAGGPIFIDWCGSEQPDTRKALVIGGGVAFETGRMYIELDNPNYRVAGYIRDRINERFGEKTANARSAGIITINPPSRYAGNNRRFAGMIAAIYLPETNESLQERINALSEALTTQDTTNAEMGLEAIGRMSLKSLRPLLEDDREYVRLRAARCMLNIGYEKAISTLINIARDNDSQRRLEAIETISEAPVSDESVAPLRALLDDYDFNVRLAVYEILNSHGDISVSTQRTMAGFAVKKVVTKGEPAVYIYRKDKQHIVIFGNDISISTPLFVKDEHTDVTINSSTDDATVSIIRQNPFTPGILGPLTSKATLSDVIFKLTDNIGGRNKNRAGMGLDYSGTASIIKELWNSGNLNAQLEIGPAAAIEIQSSTGLPGVDTQEDN
jgi:hypothetical protein